MGITIFLLTLAASINTLCAVGIVKDIVDLHSEFKKFRTVIKIVALIPPFAFILVILFFVISVTVHVPRYVWNEFKEYIK